MTTYALGRYRQASLQGFWAKTCDSNFVTAWSNLPDSDSQQVIPYGTVSLVQLDKSHWKVWEGGLSDSINSKWYTPDETANMICMQAMMDCLYHNQDIHPWNMSLTQQRFSKNFDEKGRFCMGTKCNFTETKSSISRSLIGLPVSAFAYGFHINMK